MSKMSNLKKGVVGVCAATMLTGLCAVPAFADNAADATNGGVLAGGQGTTAVSIQSQNDQISATVPSSVKMVVGTDKQFIAPTTAEIENTGALTPVSVKSVKATVGNGAALVSDLTGASDANTAILKLSKGNSFEESSAIDLSTATGADGASLNWSVDPSAKVGVQFSGEVNKLSSLEPIELVTLVWTIG